MNSSAPPENRFEIKSLDLEAQGIAHKADGKVVFVDGALPFEIVSVQIQRRKNSFEKGTLIAVYRESFQRTNPACQYFGLHETDCGGCKMQHLHMTGQVSAKQRVLEDVMWHIGKLKSDNVLRPIEGRAWGYRYRARLSVRYVRKKDDVLIGFRERAGRYVADIQECLVLPPKVSALLLPLRSLIKSLDARETCPQIELAVGTSVNVLLANQLIKSTGYDGVTTSNPGLALQEEVIALVLRHTAPLSRTDLERLQHFAARYPGLQWWLQPKGPETIKRLDELPGHTTGDLAYALPRFGVVMPFRPTDFTQVNPGINQVLVSRALDLLEVRTQDRVIDWFCGLGNFTLPLATQARDVLGIEGNEALVIRARENADFNQTQTGKKFKANSISFIARDIFTMTAQSLVEDGPADKWLLDPPREGAFALVQALVTLQRSATLHAHWTPPKRIVYVSCNPATLARDAAVLVHEGSYRCSAAGIVNMFPHTAHVESIAVFDLENNLPPVY